MKSLSIFLLGAGLFTLALCGCTSQPSQKETGMSDSIVKVQDNPVIETIMARRSIRKYKPEAVERDKMETILNCGIHAPNGMNKQSWEVRVVDNQDFINELTEIFKKENPKAAERAGFKNMFNNAPTVAFIAYDPRYDMSQIDLWAFRGEYDSYSSVHGYRKLLFRWSCPLYEISCGCRLFEEVGFFGWV